MKSATIFIFLSISCNVSCQRSSEKLNDLFAQHKMEEVVEYGKERLQKNAGDPMVNMIVGRALVTLGEHAEAIAYLEKGIIDKTTRETAHVSAWSHAYLGHCYLVFDSTELAEQHLRKCMQMRATKNSMKFAVARLASIEIKKDSINWQRIETPHFNFYFEKVVSSKKIESYIEGREIAFAIIDTFFNANLPKKIDYFTWANEEEAKYILGKPLGFSLVDLSIIHSRFNQTRGHEMTHVLVHHSTKPRVTNRFINEGIAVFFNQKRGSKLETARQVYNNNDKVSIKNMWLIPQNITEGVLYPVAGAFIEYLYYNSDREKLKDLLRYQDYESAKRIYGAKLDDLLKKFEKKLKAKR